MWAMLQAHAAADLPGGYGVALVQTLLALVAVCVLAWVVLRWSARRGLGIGATGGAVRVVERIALDARRTLYVVKVGERVLLLGAGDGAAPTMLTEIDPATLPKDVLASHGGAAFGSFADVLARLRGAAKK